MRCAQLEQATGEGTLHRKPLAAATTLTRTTTSRPKSKLQSGRETSGTRLQDNSTQKKIRRNRYVVQGPNPPSYVLQPAHDRRSRDPKPRGRQRTRQKTNTRRKPSTPEASTGQIAPFTQAPCLSKTRLTREQVVAQVRLAQVRKLAEGVRNTPCFSRWYGRRGRHPTKPGVDDDKLCPCPRNTRKPTSSPPHPMSLPGAHAFMQDETRGARAQNSQQWHARGVQPLTRPNASWDGGRGRKDARRTRAPGPSREHTPPTPERGRQLPRPVLLVSRDRLRTLIRRRFPALVACLRLGTKATNQRSRRRHQSAPDSFPHQPNLSISPSRTRGPIVPQRGGATSEGPQAEALHEISSAKRYQPPGRRYEPEGSRVATHR